MTKVTLRYPSAPPPPPPGATPFAPMGGGGSGSVSIPLTGDPRDMRSIVVPPGGFAGFAQQTPATQALFQRAGRIGGKRSAAKRKRKKSAKKRVARAAPKRRRRAKSKRPARLVKGSAAAKRYMASIRKRRKRK